MSLWDTGRATLMEDTVTLQVYRTTTLGLLMNKGHGVLCEPGSVVSDVESSFRFL